MEKRKDLISICKQKEKKTEKGRSLNELREWGGGVNGEKERKRHLNK